jgi:hypothetical protein
MSENFKRVMIGLVTVFSVAIITGNADELPFFFFVAIVCTYGLSLIVILPTLWVIGSFVQFIFWLFFPKLKKQLADNAPDAAIKEVKVVKELTSSEIAIRDYIKNSRLAGIPDEQIKQSLKDAGWIETSIDAAFADCIQKPPYVG